MQYALVEGRRNEARKGARGTCPDCSAPMVAKCGTRVRHHWAHKSRRNCDPWWENETDWHREWKSHFPEECREVSHTAPDGEIHRADIKTPTGIVIEVQHSTMTDAERESRESFYGNLLWILDGSPFKKSFHLGCMLPDPDSEGVEDIVWCQESPDRVPELPGADNQQDPLVLADFRSPWVPPGAYEGEHRDGSSAGGASQDP